MKSLTPQEVLKAIADGVKLEHKWIGSEWTVPSEWKDFNPLENSVVIENIFNGKYIFRLCQETITIGDVSFPKPESNPLKDGTEYWVAEPAYQHYIAIRPSRWAGDDLDRRFLHRGLVHLTKENAIAHAKALIKLSGGKVDE